MVVESWGRYTGCGGCKGGWGLIGFVKRFEERFSRMICQTRDNTIWKSQWFVYKQFWTTPRTNIHAIDHVQYTICVMHSTMRNNHSEFVYPI
jgi:hypothetical protein